MPRVQKVFLLFSFVQSNFISKIRYFLFFKQALIRRIIFFCVCLNIKRLNFPPDCNQELFNRILSVYIYGEISKQLQTVLVSLQSVGFIEKLLGYFNNDRKKLVKSLQGAVSKLIEFNEIVRNGNSDFQRLSIGTMGEYRELCLNYFQAFVNNRLQYYFHDDEINVNLLSNNNHNFEKLVLSSMGNSRDFGTMLLKCWSEYRSYRTRSLAPGRPFQYIRACLKNKK